MARPTYGANDENTNSNRKSQRHTAGFMRTPRIFAILVLISSAISTAGAQDKALKRTTPTAPKRVVHIVSPDSDQALKATTVSITYEVSSHKRASARPDLFRVQLDSQPPVETSDTTYTFDNLMAGQHDLSVELLDAKHRPITASKAEMSFVTELPEPDPQVEVAPMMPPTLQKVAMFLPQAAAPIDPGDGSAEMPLLTVIGLGVLVGGMVSAMKTRT